MKTVKVHGGIAKSLVDQTVGGTCVVGVSLPLGGPIATDWVTRRSRFDTFGVE